MTLTATSVIIEKNQFKENRMEMSQEILQQLLDSQKHLIKGMEQQNAKIDSLVLELGEVKEQNSFLKLELGEVKEQNSFLKLELKEVKEQNSFLTKEVFRLVTLNKELTQRFDSFEDKLGLLDKQFKGLAPILRQALEEDSIMFEPGYFELRDEEYSTNPGAFSSAKEIIIENSYSLRDGIDNKFKNERGLQLAFSKKLSELYSLVTLQFPVKDKRAYRYWLEAEELIVKNALRLFNSIGFAV